MGTGPPKAGAGIRRVAAGVREVKKRLAKKESNAQPAIKRTEIVREKARLGIFIPSCGTNHHPITMIGIMNSSRLTVYPYGVASAGGVCVGAGIRTVCRAIPAGTATIASMATTSNALFCGSEELREEGLDIRGTSRNFRKFCITVPLYRKHYY